MVVLLAAAAWGACFHFPQVWQATGIGEGDKLFLDLDSWLVAGEAAQHGIDPYQLNPLDVYHRPHFYSEWWLVSGKLGLTRQDSRWLGVSLLSLSLVGAVLLARPATGRQAGLMLLVLASPALLMAVNRANIDLVVFLLMTGAFALLRDPRGVPRLLAVVLLAIAGVLKYFPLAAVVVLLDARTRREWLGWLLVYGMVLMLAWPAAAAGLHSAAKYRPSPEWLYAFGAPVIFRDFALVAPPAWLLLGSGGAVAVWLARHEWRGITTGQPESAAEREFAGGAALLVGCFALGSSYAYKLVFALWLLPWLWRRTAAGPEQTWRRATLALLLAVLWLEGLAAVVINGLGSPAAPLLSLRLLQVALAVSQLLTWALIISLLRSLLIYAGQNLARLTGARRAGPSPA